MKTIFKNYIIPKIKLDKVMEYLSSDDKEVVMVGAGIMKEMMGIGENIIRTTVESIRLGDKISFSNDSAKKGHRLASGIVKSIGKKNIIVEDKNGTTRTSIHKDNLKDDIHFSIETQ